MKSTLLLLYILTSLYSYSQGHSAQKFPPSNEGSLIFNNKNNTLYFVGISATLPDEKQTEVWTFDGKVWTRKEMEGPGSRSFFRCVLDPQSGILYGFGGVGSLRSDSKSDLWSFDGLSWKKELSNAIGTKDHHNMVYADHLNAIVLYGGSIGTERVLDSTTWIIKNKEFKELKIPGPGKRYHTGMAYDKLRKKVVLYGGGEHPGELWEFDGSKWEKVETSYNPGNRYYHKMVYDEQHKAIVLHGGWRNQNPRDSFNLKKSTTWSWNGKSWKLIAESDLKAADLTYDSKKKVVVAYGKAGSGQDADWAFWELRNDNWMQIANFGKWDDISYLKSVIESNPNDTLALFQYSDILQWRTKQFDEAEKAYKKILNITPNRTDLYRELALVLLMQGKTTEAEIYLSKMRSSGSLTRSAMLRFAGLLHMEKRYHEAIPFYEEALQLERKGSDYFNVAKAYSKLQMTDKAFEALSKAIDLGYNNNNQYDQEPDIAALKQDARWQELKKNLK